MKMSLLSKALYGAWMLEPEAAAAMMPIVHGILAGHLYEPDEKDPLSSQIQVLSKSASGYAGGGSHQVVNVIKLQGTMMREDSCEYYGTNTIAKALRDADADSSVLGHVIVTDSGGGAADSVAVLADAIKACSKPVVAWVDGTAASAAIYAISYCKHIMSSQPLNRIGCIGTMVTVSGWPAMRHDSDGYVSMRIYADQSEEKNQEYEEALKGNVKIIKETVLNPLAEQFILDMKQNRPAVADDQLKGRTYFARDVVGTLIDSIGTLDDAVALVQQLASPTATNINENDMKKYVNLSALPLLAAAVCAQDGSITLTEEQLQAIETTIATLTQERTDLTERVATQESTISSQDARITELNESLAQAIARLDEEKPGNQQVHGDPAGEQEAGKPAQNHEEALAVCREFLERTNF